MVIQIAVTGGKGGTGKSFIAVNLATLLATERDVVLADLDLEAPNDHILLSVKELENEEAIELFLPSIDTSRCKRCGECARICSSSAILLPPKSYPIVFPRLCSGCTACLYACPHNAITESSRVVGYSYVTKISPRLTLVTGILREGEEHVPPAIVVVKKRALGIAKDILLIDTGAGTGSSITISLQNSDLVIAVTEPTPLGAHDLRSILEVVGGMKLRVWIVINRWEIGDDSEVKKIAKEYGVEEVFYVPYHMDAVESYIKGVPVVVYKPHSIVSKSIFEIYEKIRGIL